MGQIITALLALILAALLGPSAAVVAKESVDYFLYLCRPKRSPVGYGESEIK